MNESVQKAIQLMGSQTKLAQKLGVSQSAVHGFLYRKHLRMGTCYLLSHAVKGQITAEEFRQGTLEHGSDEPSARCKQRGSNAASEL